jgi:hypothetical protein
MYVWDGIVLVFLMFWMIGLLTELQRTEVLSLQKLLHLPVSLAGTFVINYLGSLVSVSLVVFFPAMIGLCIALVAAKGPAMLLVFPLLASFLLLVTAITYQFQGWLAALMVNPRRRRTIIVGLAMIPLGMELLLHHFGRLRAVPIYFITAWLQLGVVVWIYRLVLMWQGRLLQEREQKILSVVTSKVE